MRFIFDLDGTVIDSTHRQGDGSLDDWRRHTTIGNIKRDRLLPLADKMQGAIQDGLDVWVCTSRVMGKADFAFLRAHGLHPLGSPILHRISDADDRACGALKLAKLQGMASGMGVSWARFEKDTNMYDDSNAVHTTHKSEIHRVNDPVNFNHYQATA